MKLAFSIHRLSLPQSSVALWSGCCAVFVLTSILGILYLRELTLCSVRHIQKIEGQCKALRNRSTALAAYIAQMRSPVTFPADGIVQCDFKGNVLKVRDWDQYKKAYLMRNALAWNYRKDRP
ncbi:MAG: hypothetical protein LW808_003950 [Verrucomicrobiota bacterium]|nr:MAG: hypothetical protein LW808_003950 [Verrucomicrobiota bacterium]